MGLRMSAASPVRGRASGGVGVALGLVVAAAGRAARPASEPRGRWRRPRWSRKQRPSWRRRRTCRSPRSPAPMTSSPRSATLECYLVGPGESEKVPVHIEVMTVTADGTANFNISVGKAAPGRATPKSPKG